MFPKTKTRRNNNKKLLGAMDAFEPASSDLLRGTCGNIQSLVNPTFKKVGEKYKNVGGLFKGETFYDKVSAPYLLAKLVASYPGLQVNTEGQDGYKVTWIVVLKHKETGGVFTLRLEGRCLLRFQSNAFRNHGPTKNRLRTPHKSARGP